jgi:4,5-DOPA dioxygenase extradiol
MALRCSGSARLSMVSALWRSVSRADPRAARSPIRRSLPLPQLFLEASVQPQLPTLFLSHGAPDILLSEHPLVAVFRGLAARLPTPRAIVVISAHWIDSPVGITGAGPLPIIHDFGGFPEILYAEQYAAHGSAELCAEVGDLLDAAGIPYRVHDDRGLDHGAWIPLKLTCPSAEPPVLQVSLPVGDLHACARLGEALGPLPARGVLVIGSGGSVHNLRLLKRQGPPDPWAPGFEGWLRATVEAGAFGSLVDPAAHPEDFGRAHPSLEHFAPLVVAWAAGGRGRPGRRFAEGFMYGNLGMSCYAFGETDTSEWCSGPGAQNTR